MYASQILPAEDLNLLHELKKLDPTYKLAPKTVEALKKKLQEAKTKDERENSSSNILQNTMPLNAIIPSQPYPVSTYPANHHAASAQFTNESKLTECFEDIVKRLNEFENTLKKTTRTKGSIAALLKWDIRFESGRFFDNS